MGIPNETRIVGDAHSKDFDWIMKLSTFLLPFALGASPPPMSKTCPDCVGFDNAAQNLIQLNNKIIQTWLNLINAQCSGLPGNEQAICSLVADVGFTNWMNVILGSHRAKGVLYRLDNVRKDSSSVIWPKSGRGPALWPLQRVYERPVSHRKDGQRPFPPILHPSGIGHVPGTETTEVLLQGAV